MTTTASAARGSPSARCTVPSASIAVTVARSGVTAAVRKAPAATRSSTPPAGSWRAPWRSTRWTAPAADIASAQAGTRGPETTRRSAPTSVRPARTDHSSQSSEARRASATRAGSPWATRKMRVSPTDRAPIGGPVSRQRTAAPAARSM
ncbi:MAG: hypothetical protein AVDCRST_MAG54-542 [uncultured Actinomycetospora sp.]|uniref:Uncharacterized protein n=1 Tax=uncultured Actinomycetospora sp. TaxID=1135996 RepID=A0A6J4HDA3_9PSEU|nr:MAG: hypothetical protein AVDCRST_MAG54-542 [uncultured Actinomycetospora sp.]